MSDHAFSPTSVRFDGVVLVLALLLIVAPWALGYAGNEDAAATSIVSGVAIAACVISSLSDFTRGFREVDLALGVFAALAPFIFRFGGEHRAVLAHLVVGGATALISAGELFGGRGHEQPAHAFWHFWDDKQ